VFLHFDSLLAFLALHRRRRAKSSAGHGFHGAGGTKRLGFLLLRHNSDLTTKDTNEAQRFLNQDRDRMILGTRIGSPPKFGSIANKDDDRCVPLWPLWLSCKKWTSAIFLTRKKPRSPTR
jgi:hypothetical protein